MALLTVQAQLSVGYLIVSQVSTKSASGADLSLLILMTSLLSLLTSNHKGRDSLMLSSEATEPHKFGEIIYMCFFLVPLMLDTFRI